MSVAKITSDLAKLGGQMLELAHNFENSDYAPVFEKAMQENPWFTSDSIRLSFQSIGRSLTAQKITHWLSNYPIEKPKKIKTIGLILAGNLPLVGLHDILCVLISGNRARVKLSSKDQHLYQIVSELLIKINPWYQNQITFTDQTIKEVDAIIATGSDNSARYFESYFEKYPHIIRKNRNAVALLTGNETLHDLEHLATDIFSYFGLGCRNVSFLLIPKGFEINRLFESFAKFSKVIQHNKYANNYDYQKALLLLNQESFHDNGMVLLKEDPSLSSPIAVLHYQYYSDIEQVTHFVGLNKTKIQCIVSKTKWPFATYELGEAQHPELWDYADNVNTLDFLLNLNSKL
ncbi:MAG: acyl-CoA reductase [Salinivirgaceae bacterium]